MSASNPSANFAEADACSSRARALIAEGRWADAESAFVRAIEIRRRAASTISKQAKLLAVDLSDLAHVQLSAGHADRAEASAREAISADRKHSFAHCNLGAALRAKGEFRAAADCYAIGAKLNPSLLQATFFHALSLTEAGEIDLAIPIWRAVLSRVDNRLAALRDILVVMLNHGVADRAGEFALSAMKLNPTDIEMLALISSALVESKLYVDAEAAAERALAINSASAAAHFAIALVHHKQSRFERAIDGYQKAIAIDPQFARAFANLGDALMKVDGRRDEALAALQRAAEIAPNDLYVQLNFSSALMHDARPDEAIEVAKKSQSIAPNSPEVLINLGSAQHDSGKYSEAVQTIRSAIAIAPTNQTAHRNLGIALLSQGNFAEGWREYDARPKPPVADRLSEWTGGDLDGQPIALVAEQGFGDSIQFVRYARWVRDSCHGQPIVVCPASIADLLKRAEGVDGRVVSAFDKLQSDVKQFQHLLTLPRLAGTNSLNEIPGDVPYLTAPPMTERLKQRIGKLVARRQHVGIVWAGNPKYSNDRRRSVALETLVKPLASHASLISLQIGEAANRDRAAADRFGILPIDDLLVDFSATASVIAQLDLVITVDTAVAHLAGALNRPVWILLPTTADWRWLRDRDDSPWYPSARLFRQRTAGDWDEVVSRVAAALQEFAAEDQTVGER